jgi:hypothetical protein
MSSTAGFASLGLPPPRKTFLETRSSRQVHSARDRDRPTSSGGPAPTHIPHSPPSAGPLSGIDTKAVILNEHKVELMDMLHESMAMLKNVYRTKFIFGDQLKYVDPSYGGDSVNEFNLATPPSFDPSYVPPPVTAAREGQQGQGANAVDDSGAKEKLRTAEELIKKLYRRNTHLETETKYLKAEVQRLERFQGLGRTESYNFSSPDGHLPLDHPLLSRKYKRNCRSCPPTRTMLRAVVQGKGLAFPPRGGAPREEPAPKEDPLPVAQLKTRVNQLTEALIAVQHENEKLAREKSDRVSYRDTLLRNYVIERDSQIATLHKSLQELLAKVANPMKLTRSKQPASAISPVVAANNVLRDISQRLSEQVQSLTQDIVRQSTAANPLQPGAAALDTTANAEAEEEGRNNRRKELTRRLKTVVDTLPLQKRKQIVLLLSEIKQLFDAVTSSNKALMATYEQFKVRANKDIVQLKLEVAMLRDELRASEGQDRNQHHGGNGEGDEDPDDP